MTGQSKTVVIINDHKLLNDLLCLILANSNFQVVGVFTDIEQGLCFIVATPPSLVIIDLMLPFLRSPRGNRSEQTHPYILYDMQPSLKAVRIIAAKCPETRILLLTGERHPRTFMIGFEAGAHGIVSKVEDLSTFIDIIHKVMAGKKNRITSQRITEMLKDYSALPLPELSRLEVQILELIQEGLDSREIGAILGYSAKTIRNSLCSINQKLGTSNRFEATEVAIEMGLVGWRSGHEGKREDTCP